MGKAYQNVLWVPPFFSNQVGPRMCLQQVSKMMLPWRLPKSSAPANLNFCSELWQRQSAAPIYVEVERIIILSLKTCMVESKKRVSAQPGTIHNLCS